MNWSPEKMNLGIFLSLLLSEYFADTFLQKQSIIIKWVGILQEVWDGCDRPKANGCYINSYFLKNTEVLC